MIQANELRIGNFIKRDGIALHIVAIDDYVGRKSISAFSEKTDCFELPFEAYEPIPITSEILEKCGFDGKNHPTRRFIRLDGIFTLYFEHGILTMEDEDWCQNSMPHIKFLHQLQNLYYALTNQELEINFEQVK